AMAADPDSHVRAAAIVAAQDPRLFQPTLLRGLVDADPRVRMAAAHSLANAADAGAAPALLATLKNDHWPAVRALSAEALGSTPVSLATDQQLVTAVADESWVVRRASLAALGVRNAQAHAEVVLERLDDD